jgi:biopolymer transport protein ExbD
MSPSPRSPAIAGINVTPLVDVMLVLLIIFMLVTPLLTGMAGFQSPRSDSADAEPGEEALTVRVHADGALRIAGRPGTLGEIAAALASRRSPALVLEADRRVAYGSVQGVIEAARSAGVRTVAVVTEREPR